MFGIPVTVLFFDEANTSHDCLNLCSEMMTDGTFGGERVT